MELYHVNYESDQVEGVKDDVIDEFLDLIGDEWSFINGGGYTQHTLDGDMIVDILQ